MIHTFLVARVMRIMIGMLETTCMLLTLQIPVPRNQMSEAAGINLKCAEVVWVGSTSVGCGSELCAGAALFSCNYWPPGNYLGEFQQNVLQN